ncbi:MAG: phosphoribosylanthranilate isomerase [Deltaproteobacteria bacterium]|nr:phosphoribosylanthranilate isomerase [Candidatus Zymogenaceae bacterium]
MTFNFGRTRVKICGITRVDDALVSADHGADAVGFVFHRPSRRYIEPKQARDIIDVLPPFIQTIGVFADERNDYVLRVYRESGVNAVQVMNAERASLGISPSSIIPVVRMGDGTGERELESIPEEQTVLLDTFIPGEKGGTGVAFDWDIAKRYARGRRIIVAGGLRPENVADLIDRVRPYGVDVSSGVEDSPERKDHEKIARFLESVRIIDGQIQGA